MGYLTVLTNAILQGFGIALGFGLFDVVFLDGKLVMLLLTLSRLLNA